MSKSLLSQVPSSNILEGLSWQSTDKYGGELTQKHMFFNTKKKIPNSESKVEEFDMSNFHKY